MSKIFCDPIHGQISLHPACVAIIDTPQFQRLRHIKQTGLLEYVFPGATHNRFGHSLGVCYLAGKFIKHLQERQPELEITETDVLCIEIAALCHDLGHGPLSHTWENYMSLHSQRVQNEDPLWKHEAVSMNMFDYLVKQNQLALKLECFGIGAKEISVIKSLIGGTKAQYKDEAFLFQIVNNEDSGLDVDKWDYFLRDCHYLGISCSFQYERLMQSAKVMMVDGMMQICYRDKVIENVYDVFRTRCTLHKTAYQHRVLKRLDAMYCDAVLQADGNITGPSGEKLYLWKLCMSAAFCTGPDLDDALHKYSSLTDDFVLCALKYCPIPEVVSLINAIEMRSCETSNIYLRIALKVCPFWVTTLQAQKIVSKHLFHINQQVMQSRSMDVESDPSQKKTKLENESIGVKPVIITDIDIQVLSIDWGKKSQNPVLFVHFYSKNNSFVSEDVKLKESALFLPKSFEEVQLHVLCKRSDDYAIEVTKRCFDILWKELKVLENYNMAV